MALRGAVSEEANHVMRNGVKGKKESSERTIFALALFCPSILPINALVFCRTELLKA